MAYNKNGKNNPNWKGGISTIQFECVVCKATFTAYHKRKPKFCSVKCKGEYQKTLTGQKSMRWSGGIREKECLGCGNKITWHKHKPYSSFLNQKFCSKKCADKYGYRYKGEQHPNWNGGRCLRDMKKQQIWSKKIFKRDDYTCQECGKRGGDLQAHHKLGFTEYPNSRWFISNGLTLCKPCHYKTYKFYGNQITGRLKNGVNSGEIQNGQS